VTLIEPAGKHLGMLSRGMLHSYAAPYLALLRDRPLFGLYLGVRQSMLLRVLARHRSTACCVTWVHDMCLVLHICYDQQGILFGSARCSHVLSDAPHPCGRCTA
jgi:hypothetical protein